MADKNAEVAVEDNGGMKKTLSLWNFFTIGFGAIIGTGWVLQVGDWMVVGGGPVPAMIAFLLGAIFLVPVGAVFGELTAAIPISGGIVEYVDRSFGRTLSYITGWLLALGNGILCPWEAIAISTLVSEMFGSLPGLEWLRAVKLYTILGADVYLFPTLIALGFATYVIFLNFRGASSAAKLQAFLTKALLCGMLLAMGVSLFTGSPDNAMPVDESARTGGCTNPYGWTKYVCEQILRDYVVADPSWSVVLLRYFNPIGAHQSGLIGEDPRGVPNNLMPYISQTAIGRRECLSVFGDDYDTPDGTGVRDYIHVVDLARGHVCAIKKLETNCGLFICNLGTGKGYSVLEVLHAFEKACGKKIPYVIDPRRPGDIAECWCDPSKAKRELGWEAQYGIEEMCAHSWNWQSHNPNGFADAE